MACEAAIEAHEQTADRPGSSGPREVIPEPSDTRASFDRSLASNLTQIDALSRINASS
jgi:hypothetical protein